METKTHENIPKISTNITISKQMNMKTINICDIWMIMDLYP